MFVWWWIPIHISRRKHVRGGCRFLHFILSHLHHHQEESLLKILSPLYSSSMAGTIFFSLTINYYITWSKITTMVWIISKTCWVEISQNHGKVVVQKPCNYSSLQINKLKSFAPLSAENIFTRSLTAWSQKGCFRIIPWWEKECFLHQWEEAWDYSKNCWSFKDNWGGGWQASWPHLRAKIWWGCCHHG